MQVIITIKIKQHVTTIVGGAVFVGSQAWNKVRGEYGAIELKEVKLFNLLIQ